MRLPFQLRIVLERNRGREAQNESIAIEINEPLRRMRGINGNDEAKRGSMISSVDNCFYLFKRKNTN